MSESTARQRGSESVSSEAEDVSRAKQSDRDLPARSDIVVIGASARDGHLLRYRCHTGHAFSEGSLRAAQSNALEDSLYSALRAVEDKATLLHRLSEVRRDRQSKLATNYEAKPDAMEQSAHAVPTGGEL